MDKEEHIITEEKSNKKSLDINIIIAISLGIISLCALFVSVYQTKILAEQQELMTAAEKAQLWPNINADFGGLSESGFYKQIFFKITNDGIGPAILEDFSLKYKNKKMKSWLDVCRLNLTKSQESAFFENVSYTNRITKPKEIIPAGETLVLFEMAFKDYENFQHIFKRFVENEQPSFSLTYSSVFQDKWELTGRLDNESLPIAIEK